MRDWSMEEQEKERERIRNTTRANAFRVKRLPGESALGFLRRASEDAAKKERMELKKFDLRAYRAFLVGNKIAARGRR